MAKLANLPLTDDEEEKFALQLSETLDSIKSLDEVNTESVKPTSQVTGLVNIVRDDKVTPSLPQEEAFQNVKSSHRGYVKVKAVLEGDR